MGVEKVGELEKSSDEEVRLVDVVAECVRVDLLDLVHYL